MKRLSPKMEPQKLAKKQRMDELEQRLQVMQDKRAKGKLTLEDLGDKLDMILEHIRMS